MSATLESYLARLACAVADPGRRAGVYLHQGMRHLLNLPVPQLSLLLVGLASASLAVYLGTGQSDRVG